MTSEPVTIYYHERDTIIAVCGLMLEEMPDQIAEEVDLWRADARLGTTEHKNVLHVTLRRRKNGVLYERTAPIWPQ